MSDAAIGWAWTPSALAAASIARSESRAPSLLGFQMTSIRLRLGIASRRSSNRLPYSSAPVEIVKPVTFPPGRARLSTSSCRTKNSVVAAPITMGVAAVACFAAVAAGPPSVTMTSTFKEISSAASADSRSTRPAAARASSRTSG